MHAKCQKCGTILTDQPHYRLVGVPYCDKCFERICGRLKEMRYWERLKQARKKSKAASAS